MKKLVFLNVVGSLVASAQAEVNSYWFDSVYVGAGIVGNFVNNDMTEDCNYAYVPGMGALPDDAAARKLKDKNTRRIMGSLVLGAGKTFSRGFYAGLEGCVDLTKSKTHNLQIESSLAGVTTSGIIKNDGKVYSIGVRLGFTSNNILVYLKPSVQFNKVTIDGYTNDYVAGTTATGKSGHASKNTAFALALGAERSMCNNNFSLRLEGEYVFPTTVKAESKTARIAIPAVSESYQYTLKAKVKRMNVRLLGVYNIKY